MGCGLDVGVGVQLKKVKVTNFLYRAVSLPQKNMSTYKVSSVLCGCIWYTGSLTSLPNKVETLKTMAYPFISHSKPKALKRESLLNTFADEGLNIVDIRTKI